LVGVILNKNIVYSSKQLVEFYSKNRFSWDDLYPSERVIFQEVAEREGTLGKVLDVGCACGGLRPALGEKLQLDSYTGIDINAEMIAWANNHFSNQSDSCFVCNDITKANDASKFDTVISLSCIDWNIQVFEMLQACWEKVADNGNLIISLRLTPEAGINDFSRSFQYINFLSQCGEQERANYVVFNSAEALGLLSRITPTPIEIGGFGYWGKPSEMAVTVYDKLVFAVFYLMKGSGPSLPRVRYSLDIPGDTFGGD
jgi:precorrin-6B methylase 2